MLGNISNLIHDQVRSEQNIFARITGKSMYEVYTGKKPNRTNYGEVALRTAVKVAVMLVSHPAIRAAAEETVAELRKSGKQKLNTLVDSGEDTILRGAVDLLGKSEHKIAHGVLQATNDVVTALAQLIRKGHLPL